MRKWIQVSILILCFGLQQVCAEERGDENSELNLIPEAIGQAKEGRASADEYSALSGKAYLENALTGWSIRSGLFVPVPIPTSSWQNRTSLDFNYNWQFNERIRFSLSNRLNIFEGDTIPFPSGATVRNDFREGLVSCEIFPRTYLDAGRINLKYGVALGYNPTDFFKSRTTVNLPSIDPSELKNDRLGATMIEGQKIWDVGSLTLAFAPRLQKASPLLVVPPRASFDPLFGQTNSANRFLASFSYNISDINPQALVFVDDICAHFGVNLSRVMSSSVVAYVEWSGVDEANLTARAVAFGQKTGTLPAESPIVPQSGSSINFQNDLALGLSWTSSYKLTINLEYHFHQAGFSGDDFNKWISLGSANSRLSSELWFIREYAEDRQEPLMQNEFFLRFDYPDVLPSKLNLGAVIFISPYDGSVLAQTSAQYFLSRNWTIGAYLGGALGSRRSQEGSLPWSDSAVVQLVRYF